MLLSKWNGGSVLSWCKFIIYSVSSAPSSHSKGRMSRGGKPDDTMTSCSMFSDHFHINDNCQRCRTYLVRPTPWTRKRGRLSTSSATSWRSLSSCSMVCVTCPSMVTSNGRHTSDEPLISTLNCGSSSNNTELYLIGERIIYFSQTCSIMNPSGCWKSFNKLYLQQSFNGLTFRGEDKRCSNFLKLLHFTIISRKYGLKRWQIGEIASKIGQLYYHY